MSVVITAVASGTAAAASAARRELEDCIRDTIVNNTQLTYQQAESICRPVQQFGPMPHWLDVTLLVIGITVIVWTIIYLIVKWFEFKDEYKKEENR